MSIWQTLAELSESAKKHARGEAAQQRYMPTLDEAEYRIRKLMEGSPVSQAGAGMSVPTASADDILAAAMDAITPVPVGPLKTVYHGTPHLWAPEPGFPQGRPLLSKIGTGEGAQAYGHGIYFSEAPEVAQDYANTLGVRFSIDGRPLVVNNKVISKHPNEDVDNYLGANLGDIDAAIKDLKDDMEYVRAGNYPERAEEYRPALDILEDLKERGAVTVERDAQVYSLDLPDESIPGLLDWDKPLAYQPGPVKEGMRALLQDVDILPSHLRGMGIDDLMYELSGGDALLALGKGPHSAQLISEAGIPGVQYWDAMSRTPGEGTRNFVIWDQGLLDAMPILGVE